jgi:hypothetical protein
MCHRPDTPPAGATPLPRHLRYRRSIRAPAQKVKDMPTPPARLKNPATFSPDEVYRSMHGETILSPEFVAYRNDAMKAAGLDDEVIDEAGAKPLADRTPDQHLDDIRRGR